MRGRRWRRAEPLCIFEVDPCPENTVKPALLSPWFALALLVGCGGEAAPISDGSFLTYEIGETTRVQVTFEAAGGGDFRIVAQTVERDGTPTGRVAGHGLTVDGTVRTPSGAPVEVATFGPIRVPPRLLEARGRVYGAPVAAVREEQGRDVAVITSVLGLGAAVRGAWYYDVATGFAIGGVQETAVPGIARRFRLVDTNVAGLTVPRELPETE